MITFKAKIFTFSLLIFTVFVFNGSEFFHNHDTSINEPDNCPVGILSHVLSSLDIHDCSLEIAPLQFHTSDIIILLTLPTAEFRQLHSGRAPPLSQI